MLLALDTSTSCVTAAVADRGRVLAESSVTDHRRHGELLAPAVAEVLRQAGVGVAALAALAVGVGPGPFTGLRVGIVTARVLGLTRGLPVHGVCSLDALAHQVVATGATGACESDFLVATDARRREVYWARYAVVAGRAVRRRGPEVARAADLAPADAGLPCHGRGPLLYPEALRAGGGPLDVSAGSLAVLAAGGLDGTVTGVLLPPEPLYLRRPDAAVSAPVTRAGPASRTAR